jgi:hypothetical protein
MQPGRELDCLVAEKFLGWNNTNKIIGTGDKPGYYGFYGKKVPEYSTDIAAAWEVVKKMQRNLFSKRNEFLKQLQYAVTDKTELEGYYIAWPDVFWHVTPEAICKAALLTDKV